MKDGKNRFKTYFRKEFSKKSECMNYVKYSKEGFVKRAVKRFARHNPGLFDK